MKVRGSKMSQRCTLHQHRRRLVDTLHSVARELRHTQQQNLALHRSYELWNHFQTSYGVKTASSTGALRLKRIAGAHTGLQRLGSAVLSGPERIQLQRWALTHSD